MFKCKVCAEKDKRVLVLESEIAFLRNLVHVPVNNETIPDAVHEANGILDVIDRPIEIQTHAAATYEEAEEILREREALLGGTY